MHTGGVQPFARRALATLASVHLFLREYPEARNVYREYLSLYPSSDWAWLARIRLGQTLTALNDPAGAARAYADAAAARETPAAGRVIALAYSSDGQAQLGAIADARRAAERALAERDDDVGDRYAVQPSMARLPAQGMFEPNPDTSVDGSVAGQANTQNVIVFKPGPQRIWALVFALPAIVSRWAAHGLVGDYRVAAVILHHVFMIVFFGFAVIVILRGVFKEKVIRLDHVVGTVCGYLLSGLLWGNAFVMVDILLPESFGISQRIAWQLDDVHSREFLYNYFSICTLTGLGYNDVTPIRPLADSLTWTETVFGQFYLAIVIAQLIGLKLAQPAIPMPAAGLPPTHERLRGRSRKDIQADDRT